MHLGRWKIGNARQQLVDLLRLAVSQVLALLAAIAVLLLALLLLLLLLLLLPVHWRLCAAGCKLKCCHVGAADCVGPPSRATQGLRLTLLAASRCHELCTGYQGSSPECLLCMLPRLLDPRASSGEPARLQVRRSLHSRKWHLLWT